MNRVIKFRGKPKYTTWGWVYGFFNGDCYNHYIVGDYEVIAKTVGQFTGLIDKKGREIYEGDILKSTNDENESFFDKVIFKGASFCNEPINKKETECLILLYGSIYEVVGNIHDNPEML